MENKQELKLSNKNSIKTALTILLFIISPFVVAFVFGKITGTSLLKYSAWNTTMNDEFGYFKAIITMRKTGLPYGYNAYNEVIPEYPSYGNYNYFTYLPYLILSFFTGISSQNYIVYINVLMMELSFVYCYVLLKPDIKKGILFILLSFASVISIYYYFSGMVECIEMAGAVVITSSCIYLRNGDEQKHYPVVFLICCFTVFYTGLVRPYMLAFVLPLIVLSCIKKGTAKKKIFSTFLFIVFSVFLIYFYYTICSKMCSEYFVTHGNEFKDVLRQGKLWTLIGYLYETNFIAVLRMIRKVKDFDYGFVSVFISLIGCLLTFIEIGAAAAKKDYKKSALLFSFVLSYLAIMEATILMYNVFYLSRMILVVTASQMILFLDHDMKLALGFSLTAILIYIIVFFQIARCLGGVGILSKTAETENHEVISKTKEDLLNAIPYDESSQWNCSIAYISPKNHFQIFYLLPSYAETCCCQQEYLKSSIENESLKCKYLLVKEDNKELIKAIEIQNSYDNKYSAYGYYLFAHK